MVARFITMNIPAYQTISRNILIVFIVHFREMHAEKFIQLAQKFFFASHTLHHSKYIMRDMEREIPGVSFNKTFAIGLQGVKLFFETAIFIARTGETQFFIKI